MTRAVRRGRGVSDLWQQIHNYLYYRHEEADAKRRKEQAYKPGKDVAEKNVIVQAILENGEVDDSTGSVHWEFDEPKEIVGKEVTGLTWQRSTSPLLDEDAAQELAGRLGVVDRVTHTETVWDYDMFYVLNQQGIIPDDDLDSLISEKETFSLRVVES